MSNILKTTDITSIAAMPIKKGTLDFLFNELADMRKVIIQTNAGNTNTAYILYGLIPTISGTSYAFTEGYVYYDSKIYYVPAATITVSGSNIPVFKYNTTSYTTNADPVLFSDGNTYNVHEIHNATISADIAGSGFLDWANVRYFNTTWQDAASGGRWINTEWRIYNGKLEIRGERDMEVIPTNAATWFTLPSWVKLKHTVVRRCYLSAKGLSNFVFGSATQHLQILIDASGAAANQVKVYVIGFNTGDEGSGARVDMSTINEIHCI